MARDRQFLAFFDLQVGFAPQRRAIFPHPNFKKWSDPVSFHILTCKCASRYSGVQFFHIPTSKDGPSMVCFVHFDCKRASRYSGVEFSTSQLQLQKVVRTCSVLNILASKCASRYSGVQFFISPLNSYLRTHRFSEPTFRPTRPTKH